MTKGYFQSRQRTSLAACQSQFERVQQRLTTHAEYVRHERKHPGRTQSFMDCAAEELGKAEQLIHAMHGGPTEKAHWLNLHTTLQSARNYMVMAEDDLKHSEVSSELSEVISKLSEVISELEGIKQQRIDSLDQANQTRKDRAKRNHGDWQVWADRVWQENPHWNKDGVARQIIDRYKIKAVVGTVADKLIKPVSD